MKPNTKTNDLNTALQSALPDGLPPTEATEGHSDEPLLERLIWQAHWDIESNIVTDGKRRYFGGGRKFGAIVYTRDISYSGAFAANRHYPEIMLDSLRETRRIRLEQTPWYATRDHHVPAIKGPWHIEDITEKEFKKRHSTNSWTRRTDDVVWLWAAHDLFLQHPEIADWDWLLATGERCFEELYAPFYNEDGLYSGQQSFVDIRSGEQEKSLGGYPSHFNFTDCITIRALSTNCLYVCAMDALTDASQRCGQPEKAEIWRQKAAALRAAILGELSDQDGRLCVYKEANGKLETRRDALGLALAVKFDILQGEAAQVSFADYPRAPHGVPLYDRWWPNDYCYHNLSSWPFVDTLFLESLERVDGQPHHLEAAYILARSCMIDGTFKELTDHRDGTVRGSSSQLWSVTAFLGLVDRCGSPMPLRVD